MTLDHLEDMYMGIAGVSPDVFWESTWKENALMLEAKVNSELDLWEIARFVTFATYQSTFNFDGKQVFKSIKKPVDVLPLPQDRLRVLERASRSTADFDPQKAIDAYNKTEKDKEKWLKKN